MISSLQNPLIKQIKRLRQRKYRRQEQLCFVEGIHISLTAAETKKATSLIYAPDLINSESILAQIEQHASSGIHCIPLTSQIFNSISERDNPTGVAVLLPTQYNQLSDLPITKDTLYVALHNISDPGNLGTIIRTLDAVSGTGIILVGQTTDPWHPTALKATMGALFTTPIVHLPSFIPLLDWATENKINTIATSAKGTTSFQSTTFTTPSLLLMGSEKHGLSADILSTADQSVMIPMAGSASSLNLAIATSLLLYKIRYP